MNKNAPLTDNESILAWVAEQAGLCCPDEVVWIDGSETQLCSLREEAFRTGELIELNQELLPGCVLHRSAENDVARVEARTFICCERQSDAGPTNNWMAPGEMYARLKEIYSGCMKGRTMYVIPYSMGTIGSPFAKYGIELTDSIYVVVSMSIMTRVGTGVCAAIEGGNFIKGLHSNAELDEEKRYIAHFPQDNTIMSVNSGYGGNALLGKKCFALRMASCLGRDEGWLAEHMLILGVENPRGEVRYVCGAFPSACGKTNLAMLIPPELYRRDGWKCWCVGDDIAWLRPGPDGRLWAVNPENGFFGVAPGTSEKTNPNALACTRKNSIFTNVALRPDGTVWWEGLDKTPPQSALDWTGRPWTPASGMPAAHPNSRFTSPAKNCPCISPEFENPAGVPISAIIFGGRRARTAPLVYQARSWGHGVFVGSIMASEKTAAAEGRVGELRRDPMAMLPFCGYHMADYWQHWLDMEQRLTAPPIIANVNWFRTDDSGRFLWPGFGENLRVIEWILARAFGEADAVETELGFMPHAEDLRLEGSGVPAEDVESLLSIDRAAWLGECTGIERFYERFGGKLPARLRDELEQLRERLS